ncbi:hypothetical protein BSKO_11812 [Bryopsis sp. KO-2023]|nr:hypothetical protein BSKO_11812 [Bryopsis sp. KO-2023]
MAYLAPRRLRIIELCRNPPKSSLSCILGNCRFFSDEGSSDAEQAAARTKRRRVGCENRGEKIKSNLPRVKYHKNDTPGNKLHPHRRTEQGNIIHALKNLIASSRAEKSHPNATENHLRWKAMSKQILDDLDNLSPVLLARCIHGCRVVGYWDSELLSKLFYFACRNAELVESVRPIGVSMSIQSLGMIAADQKRKKNHEALAVLENEGWDFLVKLTEACEGRFGFHLEEFKARELSSMLQGLGCYSAAICRSKQKKDWIDGKVRAIMKAMKPHMESGASPQDFSTALHGLANVQLKDADLLDGLGKWLKKPLSTGAVHFDEHSLATMVWGLSKLNLKDEELFDLLGNRVAARAQHLTMQGLPNVVYGFGVLGYKNEQLLTVLGQEISKPEKLGKLAEQGLANTVYGFSLVGHFDGKVLAALGNEISKPHRLNRFAEQELANMVYGFGLLGYDDKFLLSRLGTEVSKPQRLSKFIAQGLSNVVYGLGLVRSSDREVLESLAGEVAKPQRLQEFSAQGLANIAYGFGLCGVRNEEVLKQLGAEIASETRIDTFTGQGLVMVIYGFGKSSFFDEATFSVLLNGVTKRLGEFSPQEISTALYGFALVETLATEFLAESMVSFLDSVVEEVNRRDLRGFDRHTLSNICWSLGQLRYRNADLMGRLINASQVGDAEPSDETTKVISMMMQACAVLTIEHREFLQLSQSYILRNKERMSSRDCIHTMWSMAVLGILSVEHFTHLCKRLLVLGIDRQKLSFEEAMQIAQASLYITLIKGEKFDPTLDSLVKLAKTQCVKPTQISSFEKGILKMLLEKGISFESDKRLVDGVLPVDIFIPGTPGLVIECDGPTHYTINKVDGEYLQRGKTLFRNQVLEAAGYKVVCVPFFVEKEARREKAVCDAIEHLSAENQPFRHTVPEVASKTKIP